MGPTWGPAGPCRPQLGPMLAPSTLLSGKYWVRGNPQFINDVFRRHSFKLNIIRIEVNMRYLYKYISPLYVSISNRKKDPRPLWTMYTLQWLTMPNNNHFNIFILYPSCLYIKCIFVKFVCITDGSKSLSETNGSWCLLDDLRGIFQISGIIWIIFTQYITIANILTTVPGFKNYIFSTTSHPLWYLFTGVLGQYYG